MEDDVIGLLVSFVPSTIESETYSHFRRSDSSEMDDCVDTLEERILLCKLGDYLSIVGQIGSNEFGSDISLRGERGDLIHCNVSH